MPKSKTCELIGACYDLASAIYGCADAPKYLRSRHLMDWMNDLKRVSVTVTDGGDVKGPLIPTSDHPVRNLPELIDYSQKLFDRIIQSFAGDLFPVIIGGDHSVSIATISAAAKRLMERDGQGANLGLVWVDAHPDIVVVGDEYDDDLHATSVAHLLGYGADELTNLGGFQPKLKPEHIVMIGPRNIEPREIDMLNELNIEVYRMRDIDRLGMTEVIERTFGRLEAETTGWVLSFDMDGLDPTEAPGVQYPERGGPTFRELRQIMERAAISDKMLSMEVVEVLPQRDRQFLTSRAANQLIWTGLGGRM